MIDIINTEDAPGAVGPYSQGSIAGDLVFVSGQLPIDPATGEMPADITAQATQSLKNVKAVLAAAGCELGDVVKSTVFLADIADFAAMNEVYSSYFAAPFPARSCFQVARLPKDALVEVEVIAHKKA